MNFLIILSLLVISTISARRCPSSCSDFPSSSKCSSSSKSQLCSESSLHDNTKCSRELQAIIHVPELAEDFEDAARLEKEFRVFSPALFTAQNASFVWAFETKYNIIVKIYDGFAYEWVYTPSPPAVVYQPAEYIYQTYARSQINFSGFNYNSNNQTYLYTFTVWNNDGRILVVTLSEKL